MELHYQAGEERRTVRLVPEDGGYRAVLGETSVRLEAVEFLEGRILFRLDGRRVEAWTAREGDRRFVALTAGRTVEFERHDGRLERRAATGPAEGTLVADMHAQVISVHVAEGDEVESGDLLVVLEAMKMERRLLAPKGGRVARLAARAGEVVERGAVVVEIE
jgi:acetyl/propionyl-CoA carboxylase alpha subunit